MSAVGLEEVNEGSVGDGVDPVEFFGGVQLQKQGDGKFDGEAHVLH